jgi:GNAT superfamily N-acetyltransferase
METASSKIGPRTAGRVEIRPLALTDREGLAEAFSRLSEDTRRRRFGGVASRLGEGDLDRLTRIDHHNHDALAAIVPDTGRIVGVARYIALPDVPGVAEVAIVVDDAWQSRGIGRRLMRDLVGRARGQGITHLLGYVGADNNRVVGWIARAGGIPEARDGDAIVYGIPLDRPSEERRAA